MGKILEALARDDLCVIPSDEKPSPAYKKACECSSYYIEQLNKRLSSEDKEIFDKVVNALINENDISTDESFIRGFRLGVRLIMEVMEGEKISILGVKDAK